MQRLSSTLKTCIDGHLGSYPSYLIVKHLGADKLVIQHFKPAIEILVD